MRRVLGPPRLQQIDQDMEDAMFVPDYRPEYIFSYTAQVRLPPEVIGPTPDGIRVNFYVTGGEVDGPKLKGKVAPVGADWLLIRRDGIAILDVRATIESHDGSLIYLPFTGVSDLGPGGYDVTSVQRYASHRTRV